MHERAGDKIPKPGKPRILKPVSVVPKTCPAKVPQLVTLPVPPVSPVAANDPIVEGIPHDIARVPAVTNRCMTRRFTVHEKLRIIDKYKELKNVSATCRQVKEVFRRSTFRRRSRSP